MRRSGFLMALLGLFAFATAASADPQWLKLPPTPSLPRALHSGYAPVNGIKIWYAVFGHGKPVILLEYKGENHGLAKPENQKDYTVRMREFFDHYLMDKPAPKWMDDGVPLLKMKDELDAATKALKGSN